MGENSKIPTFTPPTAPTFTPPPQPQHDGPVCYHHPTEPAVAQCARCGKYICKDCAEAYGVTSGDYAGKCLCYDCCQQLVSENVADLNANLKKIKGQFSLQIIGMGIGFTITLTVMGSIREILGSGTWMSGLDGLLPFLPEGFAIRVIPESIDPFTIMTSAPGAFFVFGILMAAATWLTTPKAKKQKTVEAAEGGNA